MSTQLIYFQNPYQKEFTAKVLEVVQIGNRDGLILDRTLFYPTGGGQPCDTGFINDYPVIEVYEDHQQVIHVIEGSYRGETHITGKIDWLRRFDHMQQHSGQHLLSAMIREKMGLETVGFHMGCETVTIDVSSPSIDVDMLERMEFEANFAIYQNRKIDTRFESREKLDPYLIRKVPENEEYIRLVEIAEIDLNPCCGTHVANTGEIGLIQILGTENIRGNTRISFVCGLRAFESVRFYRKTVREAASIVKSNVESLVERIRFIKDENDQLKKINRKLNRELIEREAKDWLHSYTEIGPYRVRIHTWEDRAFQELKDLAKTIIEEPNQIAIFASLKPKAQVVLACSNNVPVSMLECMHVLAPYINGKGGGNKVFAQIGGDAEQLSLGFDRIHTWIKERILHDLT